MVGFAMRLFVLAAASGAAGSGFIDGADAYPGPAAAGESPPGLLVLEPVDLRNEVQHKRLGLRMVRLLQETGAWAVLGPDSLARKLQELGLPAGACREFQCAFDAANIMHTEFALYGSATEVDGLQTFTLNLLHVPSARIVWAAADEVRPRRRESAPAALEHRMGEILGELGPKTLSEADMPLRESVALVPAGKNSLHAKVVTERLAARLNSTRRYNLMSFAELQALKAALALDQEIARGDWQSVGERLGVSRILAARLEQQAAGFRLGLAWAGTDSVAGREEVESHPLPRFSSVLHFEEQFTRRCLPSTPFTPHPESHAGGEHFLPKISVLALGMAMAAGFGYHAHVSWENGKQEARQVEAARSWESAQKHRSRAGDQAQSARKSAAIGVFCLAGAIGAVWAF